MAEHMVQYQWVDGETLTVSVDLDDSFPDACNEAEASAKRLFSHAMGVVTAADKESSEAGE